MDSNRPAEYGEAGGSRTAPGLLRPIGMRALLRAHITPPMLKLVYHFQGTRRKEVRMIQRLRAVIVAVLVGLSVHTALAHQVITAVREGNVRVAVGTSVTLTLEGTELDKLQSVLVLLSGRPT